MTHISFEKCDLAITLNGLPWPKSQFVPDHPSSGLGLSAEQLPVTLVPVTQLCACHCCIPVKKWPHPSRLLDCTSCFLSVKSYERSFSLTFARFALLSFVVTFSPRARPNDQHPIQLQILPNKVRGIPPIQTHKQPIFEGPTFAELFFAYF